MFRGSHTTEFVSGFFLIFLLLLLQHFFPFFFFFFVVVLVFILAAIIIRTYCLVVFGTHAAFFTCRTTTDMSISFWSYFAICIRNSRVQILKALA